MPINWVVKVGGSLYGNPRLREFLFDLAQCGAVIVPGGGPFADLVRDAQKRWALTDKCAHAMAIAAMAQFGRMLADIEPRLAMAETPSDLAELAARGQAAIWLPSPVNLALEAIPESWDVTSDSLSAWLAARVGAVNLLLLKPTELTSGRGGLAELQVQGLVDARFGDFIQEKKFKVWLFGAGGKERLAGALERPRASMVELG